MMHAAAPAMSAAETVAGIEGKPHAAPAKAFNTGLATGARNDYNTAALSALALKPAGTALWFGEGWIIR